MTDNDWDHNKNKTDDNNDGEDSETKKGIDDDADIVNGLR